MHFSSKLHSFVEFTVLSKHLRGMGLSNHSLTHCEWKYVGNDVLHGVTVRGCKRDWRDPVKTWTIQFLELSEFFGTHASE